jgi:hypothetical protein
MVVSILPKVGSHLIGTNRPFDMAVSGANKPIY